MRPIGTLAQAAAAPRSLPAASPVPPVPEIERVFSALSHRYILVYPVLRAVTRSAKAALMLSHMLYWTRTYLADRPAREGWFWHTQIDWRNGTGLSRHEQNRARAGLRAAGLVSERLMSVPARMHFRVNLEALGAAVANHLHTAYSGWRWDDAAVKAMLGRPVVFLRGLVEVGGSVTAALYLSDLCQQQRALARNASRGYATRTGANQAVDAGAGWLDLPLGETARRLGLSGKRLRSARRALFARGLIEERSSGGMQPRTLSRVNLARLADTLTKVRPDGAGADGNPASAPNPCASAPASLTTGTQGVDFSGLAQTYIPDVPKAANWNGANVHSRYSKSGKLEVPKAADRSAAFGIPSKVVNTTELKPQLPTASAEPTEVPAHVESGSRRVVDPSETLHASTLILPECLPEAVLGAARQLLDRIADPLGRQSVADEWASQLKLPGKVRSPLAYLYGLVERAIAGRFVPAMALQEAETRVRRQRNETALAQARQAGPPIAPTTPAAPNARTGIPAFAAEQIKALGFGRRNVCLL